MTVRTLCTIALLGLLLPGWLLVAGPSQEPTIPNLKRMLAQNPDDAIVLFNLAVLRARQGRRSQALKLISALGRTRGGLDPSDIRGFSSLHEEETFLKSVEAIRAAHPPVVRSRVAYRIPEPDLQPEGMAFDPVDRAVFVGSAKGKILRVDAQGGVREFAMVNEPGSPRWVLGLHVDVKRRQLWAVVDDPRAWSDPSIGGSTLQCFDLQTGTQQAKVAGPGFGALNDLVVGPRGEVYATNTSDGSLWQARQGKMAAVCFLPPGTIHEANGIALAPDGRTLFVAGWHDIHRVDLHTRKVAPLVTPRGVVAGNLDGLYFHRGALVGIQNGVHPGRVLRFHLDPSGRSIVRGEVLEAYHPEAKGLSTGALDGDGFLFLRNTQSRAFGPDGRPLPGIKLEDIVIARLSI